MYKKPQKTAAAFTIIELLLALAITAMLLTAAAVAFNASVKNYQENENIFNAINKARQALFRITTQLRTADAVATDDPNNECSLITADLKPVTYRFNSADNKLYLVTDDDLLDSDYVLCDNVVDMTFTRDTFTEIEDVNGVPVSVTKVRSVQTSVTVQSGNLRRKLSAAAVIRRNLR
ncbi:MAG: PulJ/GspJ family protein [Planctomycetota bacterium]|jgi:type II secretory pathway pseudopilin PulG